MRSPRPTAGIEVSPDGIFDDTGYSFVWHRGSIASPPAPISGETGRQLFSLRRGIYSVEVTEENTRLSRDRTVYRALYGGSFAHACGYGVQHYELFASEWRNFCGFRGW